MIETEELAGGETCSDRHAAAAVPKLLQLGGGVARQAGEALKVLRARERNLLEAVSPARAVADSTLAETNPFALRCGAGCALLGS